MGRKRFKSRAFLDDAMPAILFAGIEHRIPECHAGLSRTAWQWGGGASCRSGRDRESLRGRPTLDASLVAAAREAVRGRGTGALAIEVGDVVGSGITVRAG